MEQLKSLDYLEGSIKVYHSTAVKESAVEIQSFLNGMSKFYKHHFDKVPKLNIIHVLKDDYKKLFEIPYGMPFVFGTPDGYMINMPAEEGVVVELFKEDYSKLPTPKKISPDYVDEHATTFVTLVGFHEIGHTYAFELGLGELCHWFSEFLATYFAYGFMKEEAPELADIWMTMNDITLDVERELTYKTLHDFDKEYANISNTAPQDYVWFQAEFNKMVEKIYNKYGIQFLKDITETFKHQSFDNSTFENKLIKIAPEFNTWIKEF